MELFSALVGQIYDTIVLPDTWPAVLASLTAYVGAARSILILEDALDPSRSLFQVSFDDPEWINRYLDTFMLINPMRLATVVNVEPGAVILTSDFMTPEEYGRSRFASEFLATRNIVDLSVVVLEATTTTISVLSFGRDRDQGFADEQVRRKLQLLGPHVRRAASIGRILDHQSLETAALAATFDRLNGAVLLLDGQGTVLHANGRARRLLSDRADRFPTPGNRLRPADAQARAILLAALQQAERGDTALGPDGVAIPFGDGTGTSWIGTVISLVDGSRRPLGMHYRAAAILNIRELRRDLPVPRAALAALYGLTRRETAIAAAIAEGGGVPAASAVLGIGVETVRTHLASVYRKTGAGGQTELVRLLASIAGPFRP